MKTREDRKRAVAGTLAARGMWLAVAAAGASSSVIPGAARLLEPAAASAAPIQAEAEAQQDLALSEFVRLDPDKVVRAERCGECHFSEHRVWQGTAHATGFDTLHRKEAAEQIASAMGFRLIKRVSLCLKCHYTPQVQRDQLRAIEGVSCESCHGAARDWVEVHSDFGVRNPDLRVARSQETPEHREQRIAAARANGMRRPSDLYDVAANCYECHRVPHEELVNVGGHSTGSGGFELVEWTQGKMRHNFLDSFFTGDGTDNEESSAARKRQMYVVGKALDLEYLLRGVALATEEGKYFTALVRSKRRMTGDLADIAESAAIPEVDAMLALVADVDLSLGNAEVLEAAADALRELTRAFIANNDGERLAALDPLYDKTAVAVEPAGPDPSAAVVDPTGGAAGEPPVGGGEPPVAGQPPARGGDAATPTTAATPPPSGAASSTADQPNATAAAATGAPTAPAGDIQTWPPWRPRPEHATLREVPCTSCHDHDTQVNWWYGDDHSTSADPLLDGEPKYLRVAVTYGLDADSMTRGDQICMQCHGTYATGRETRTVNNGVGCQRCHGPGADYKDVHQEQPERAVGLGRTELADLPTRAARCAGCHYVTDPRLISVGHPSGAEFDFVAANDKIKHWETATPADALARAYDGVIAQRGPLPSVAVIAPPTEAAVDAPDTGQGPASAAGGAASGAQPAAGGAPSTARSQAPPPGTQRQRANAGANRTPASGEPAVETPPAAEKPSAGVLPPLEIPRGASVEETLILIKRRLQLLYRLLGAGR